MKHYWLLDAPVEAGVWAGGGWGQGVQGVLARQGVAPQHLVRSKLEKEALQLSLQPLCKEGS